MGSYTFVVILVLLALVYLTNSTEHYIPTVSIQTISGDKTNTAFYTHPYNDGRRVVVGRFNSISINVGDGFVLNNADTSGTTFDIYVVMYGADNKVLWAKALGGTGEETIQYAVADQCGETRTSSDSQATTLIKSSGWNGIWVYGLSKSVQFKVPTDPPITRPNYDVLGDTNDIYVVKLNETNGDPWLSMMIGGNGEEGFTSFTGAIAGGCDVYTYLYSDSANVDFAGHEERSVGSTRYKFTRSLSRDYYMLRWRGFSSFSSTKANARYFEVTGTSPVVYRAMEYTTQVLNFGDRGLNPKLLAIEPKTQNYLFGHEFSTASQVMTSQVTVSNSATGSSDVILGRFLSNGAWNAVHTIKGASHEYVTKVLPSRDNARTTPLNGDYAVGTFKSATLSFGAQYPSSVVPTVLSNVHTNKQSGKHDVWIVNFAPATNGANAPVWSVAIGGTGDDFVDDIIESYDFLSLFVYGRFVSDKITIGTQEYDKSSTGDLNQDIYFVSLAVNTGAIKYASVFGGVKNEKIVNVTDVSDGVIVAGHYDSKTMKIGSTTLTNTGDESTYDIFVIKYTTTGTVAWAKSIGGTADDKLLSSIQIPGVPGIVLFGVFGKSTFQVGDYTLTNTKDSGSSAFIVFISNAGVIGWVKQLDGSFDPSIPPVMTRNTRGFSIAGQYSGDFAISPSPKNFTSTNAAGTDVFSAHFTTTCAINLVQCSGHGSCAASTNLCSCATNYVRSGVECVLRQCYGINYNESNVCSGNGTCLSDGTCQCSNGFTGQTCSEVMKPKCWNIPSEDQTVCGGRGTCKSTNNCICNQGYGGYICQRNCPKCYLNYKV